MGDFRVTGHTRLYVVLYCTVITAVLCTGMGKCPVYPQLPNFDVERVSDVCPRRWVMFSGVCLSVCLAEYLVRP